MLIILLLTLIAAAGQTPAAPAKPAPPAPPAEQVVDPAGYAYNAEGRRDPFVSLVGRGNDATQTATPAAGIPGLLVNEVTVKGVIRGRSGYIAMIQASDNKTYIVRSGDRLLDGVVKTITQDGVVFSQDVNDPLSLVKQREVPKRVRASEGRG
jgi:Tfp pilus assembly protein PilP